MRKILILPVFALAASCIAADTNKPAVKFPWLRPADTNKPPRMPGDMRFSEYTGKDKFDWEVSGGALSDTSYDLPVYKSWPSKPYVLIGEIYHRDARKEWQEGEFRDAVKGSQRVGGEAIIVRFTSESGVAAFTGGVRGSVLSAGPAHIFRTSALVIRWQTPSEIQARKERDEHLLKQLLAQHPDLDINNETAALVVKYLLQTDEGEISDDFGDRYKQLMTKISSVSGSDLSGEWIFKSVVREKGLVAEKEDSGLGLASVKANGDTLAIVSTKGRVEISFSGQNLKGRLTGQVGVGAVSSKAEGVALDDKISITFNTVTPDGTAQGIVILQRNQFKPTNQTKGNNQSL